jgi:hypothetical protein
MKSTARSASTRHRQPWARPFRLVGGGFDATSPFTPESYDAAALIMLAMQAAGSSEPAVYKDHV